MKRVNKKKQVIETTSSTSTWDRVCHPLGCQSMRPSSWIMDRGFLCHLSISYENFRNNLVKIFSNQPITSVSVLGYSPMDRGDRGVSWTNNIDYKLDISSPFHRISSDVFKLLKGHRNPEKPITEDSPSQSEWFDDEFYKCYKTDIDACKALSDAWVRLGRNAVGLT
jgi:hypothetical protein